MESLILREMGDHAFKSPDDPVQQTPTEQLRSEFFWKGNTDEHLNEGSRREHTVNPDSADRDAMPIDYEGNNQYIVSQENEDPLEELLHKKR